MNEPALRGLRVTVLRVGGATDELAAGLRALGADATTLCVASVHDRPDAEMREDAGPIDRYRWVAATSANAARRLPALAPSSSTHIAVVGPATAWAVEAEGLRVDLVAREGTAAGLAREIPAGPVLFVAAGGARRDLVDILESRGIEVRVVVAYHTVRRTLDDGDIGTVERSDVIVATSPSCIDALVAVPSLAQVLRSVPLVAIGPSTAAHAMQCGVATAATAVTRDAAALARAVADARLA